MDFEIIIGDDDPITFAAPANDDNPTGSLSLTAQQASSENTAMGKLHHKLAFVTGVAGLTVGYHMGVIGGLMSMESFLVTVFQNLIIKEQQTKETNFCKYDGEVLLFAVSSLYFVGAFSCFIAFILWRIWGSRRNIQTAAIFCFIGTTIMIFPFNPFIFIIGRILTGIGIGFIYQAIPQYILETNHDKAGGQQNLLFQLGVPIGFVCANLVNHFTANNHDLGWRISLIIAIVPCILFLTSLSLKETPTRLVRCGKLEKAKNILIEMKGSEDVNEELVAIREAEQQVRSIWEDLSEPGCSPSFIISITALVFQQLSGSNVVMFYSPLLFVVFGDPASLTPVYIGVANLLGIITSLPLVRQLGRRPVQFGACILMSSVLVALGFILHNLKPHTELLSSMQDHITSILLPFFVLGSSLSSGPDGWLSNAFPQNTKTLGSAITSCLSLLMTGVMTHLSPSIICYIRGLIFFFLAGVIITMGIIIFLFIPGTEDIPIQQFVEIVWGKHWFWKRFIHNPSRRRTWS